MSYVKLNNPVIDRLPFLFLGCFLCWAETFWFDIVLLIYFSFHCLCFWCLTQKKSLPRPLSKGFFSMFSSRSSMISGITCNSVTHFEFFFFLSVDPVPFFCMRLSSFPITIYWRDYPLPIVCFWCPCQSICIGLLLGSLFCSIGLYACFYMSTIKIWNTI